MIKKKLTAFEQFLFILFCFLPLVCHKITSDTWRNIFYSKIYSISAAPHPVVLTRLYSERSIKTFELSLFLNAFPYLLTYLFLIWHLGFLNKIYIFSFSQLWCSVVCLCMWKIWDMRASHCHSVTKNWNLLSFFCMLRVKKARNSLILVIKNVSSFSKMADQYWIRAKYDLLIISLQIYC